MSDGLDLRIDTSQIEGFAAALARAPQIAGEANHAAVTKALLLDQSASGTRDCRCSMAWELLNNQTQLAC